jgi:hypothetical protein
VFTKYSRAVQFKKIGSTHGLENHQSRAQTSHCHSKKKRTQTSHNANANTLKQCALEQGHFKLININKVSRSVVK